MELHRPNRSYPKPPSYLQSSAEMINIHSFEDLKKVLVRQKLCTRQAAEELGKIASNEVLQAVEGESEERLKEKAFTIIRAESLLLEKYAEYPTMTELNAMPNTPDLAIKWGATFGVALFVGELVLEQVKMIQGSFEMALRALYLILLKELDEPRYEFMIEPLEKAVKLEMKNKDGSLLPLERQIAFKRNLLTQLAEAFCLVSVSYGIMDAHPDGAYSLTPIGKRVMLHLVDAQRYVILVSEAHKRFTKHKSEIMPTDPTL